jgi:hypothetical protein
VLEDVQRRFTDDLRWLDPVLAAHPYLGVVADNRKALGVAPAGGGGPWTDLLIDIPET